MTIMKNATHKILPILLLFLTLGAGSAFGARIKDIAQLKGVRNNQLVGYGLVVGLNGSGDSKDTKFTVQSLVNMLKRLGVSVDRSVVKVNNVAAVMVTAALPPFAKAGDAIDVTVSSIGDAKSLSGGTLLMTPLKAPDGQVYAVAQGPLLVGGMAASGAGAKVQQNHPTVGRVPGGALVEKQVAFALDPRKDLVYQLDQADFTTVSRMASAINKSFGQHLAQPIDGGSLRIHVPTDSQRQLVNFIAKVEDLDVTPDSVARIVVNEKTGTIVMGQDVRIDTVAVSHGNLNLVISESPQVSQPNALSQGQTAVVPRTNIKVSEDKGNLVVMHMGVSLGDIAQALNAIGATPRDLIAIFQAIKAAGALHAKLTIL